MSARSRVPGRTAASFFLWLFLASLVSSAAVGNAGVKDPPVRPGPMAQSPAARVPALPGRIVLELGSGHPIGSPDAPVTIVEYSDYRCPACAAFAARTFPVIRRNFIDTGKVRYIRKDLPLDVHPGSLEDAQAARCAGDQGKFPEMHDLLSADPRPREREERFGLASRLSLDKDDWKACMDGGRHLDEILADARAAAAAGIRSTPSFVVGTVRGTLIEGVGITGAQPYAVFEEAIEAFLSGIPEGRGPSR